MPSSPDPVPDLRYRDAQRRLLAWIDAGQCPPGSRLPSERELGERLSMNPRTVRRALAELVAQGRIVKKPRVGNFVCEAAPEAACTQVAVLAPPYLADLDQPHPAMALFLRGVSQALDPRRHHLATMFYRPDHFWEDAGALLAPRGVRGVVLWGHHGLSPAAVAPLRDQGVHIVMYHADERYARQGYVCVALDRLATTAHLYRHLAELGHRQVCSVRYTHVRHEDREVVLANLYALLGVADWESHVVSIPNRVEVDDRPLRALFDGRPLPTAIVVPDEIMAATVMRLCHEHGVRVPQDLSLVALGDNTPHLHAVPLTAGGDGQVTRQAGMSAAHCLMQMMAGQSLDGQVVRIATTCHFRQSTAPPRTWATARSVR